MSVTNIPFVVDKLAKLDGVWKVDWIGDLTFPNLETRRSQPSFSVQLSQHPFQYKVSPTVHEWLPIGLLPFVKVGDFWENGRPTGETYAHSQETFDSILINSESSRLFKAGGRPDAKTYGCLNSIGAHWLSAYRHPWHLKHTHSNCIIIRGISGAHIAIPCMELIRFYFGSSSSLLTTLFSPYFSKNSLAKQYIKRTDGSVFLRLADGMSGASAADIARILYSPEAWKAATLIGKSILKYASIGTQIYPKCFFPFEGNTTLSASGQWLPLFSKGDPLFLVFEILSCSHEFPFKSIRYVASRNPDKFPSSSSEKDRSKRNSQNGVNNELLSLTDEDPDEKRKTKYVQFFSAQTRFPDLENKTIFRNTSFSKPTEQSYGGASASAFSVGSIGNGKGITPVEIENGIEQKTFDINELPEFVKNALSDLADVSLFTLMTPYSSTDYTFLMPVIMSPEGNIYAGCFIRPSEGEQRRRLMACVQVDYVDRVEAILILEPRAAGEMNTYSFELSDEFLDLCLVKKQLKNYLSM